MKHWLRSRQGAREREPRASDLPDTLLGAMDTLTQRFAQQGIDFALIGGIALALHGLPRATRDVDFIVDSLGAEKADAILVDLGFERLQKNEIFGNYLLGSLRVDLLFTKGVHSRRMLERAPAVKIRRGQSKLVGPEDLIGLKLQALANNPARPYDKGDIELLLEKFADTIDMELVRDYFRLFGREAELDAILETLGRRGPRNSQRGS